MLDRLADVGLGYISLGQMLNALSGGERQRLKLAIEMSGDADVFVLDEPTSGLHMHDVDNLISLLDRLVDSGRTVVVIEHNLDVVGRADWSSTWAQAPATKAAEWCSKARRLSWLRSRDRSPGSTCAAARPRWLPLESLA